MFVQMGGLAEAFATLRTGIRLFSGVNANVLLTVSQVHEGLAADFAGVFLLPFHQQHMIFSSCLLALGHNIL